MGNILVIDHPIEGKPSYFIKDLVALLEEQGLGHECRAYTDLEGVHHESYVAVISASGYCTIRTPEAQSNLGAENDLADRCEKESKPFLGIGHGAQIRAVHLWGNDTIEEAKSAGRIYREGTFSDHIVPEHAVNDPIFTDRDPILRNFRIRGPYKDGYHIYGKDGKRLMSREAHKYDIENVEELNAAGEQPHRSLLLDPNGNTILAGHTNPNVVSYFTQMQSELDPALHDYDYGFEGRLNSVQLLINFLNMVRERK